LYFVLLTWLKHQVRALDLRTMQLLPTAQPTPAFGDRAAAAVQEKEEAVTAVATWRGVALCGTEAGGIRLWSRQ